MEHDDKTHEERREPTRDEKAPSEHKQEPAKEQRPELTEEQKHRRARRFYWIGGSAFGVLLLTLVLFFVLHRHSVNKEAKQRDEDVTGGPHVQIAVAQPSPAERKIVLTGESRPFASVTLYAKLTGYLGDIKVDKGDEVKKGQLLAIVNSPETTRNYQGATADAWNKREIAKRMRVLLKEKLVSQQEADQAISESRVSDMKVEALAVQKGYQILKAPFDGTITQRFIDPGTLVQESSSAVVTLSEIKQLRVYAYVDQRDAGEVKVGQNAVVSLPERPELKVESKVARVAGELDPKTRMMLVEVDVDNTKGVLVAGSFVQVELAVPSPVYLEVPVEAIVQKGQKLLVPVVDAQNTVHYREVQTADNDGMKVKILKGLQSGERVAVNLGVSVPDGQKIRPAETGGGDQQAKQAQASPGQNNDQPQNLPTGKAQANQQASPAGTNGAPAPVNQAQPNPPTDQGPAQAQGTPPNSQPPAQAQGTAPNAQPAEQPPAQQAQGTPPSAPPAEQPPAQAQGVPPSAQPPETQQPKEQGR